MKRILLTSIFALTAIAGVIAKPVTPDAAKAKAQQIMGSRFEGFDTANARVTAVSHNGTAAYYVVQFADGWTLIAADDTSQPLIGYSDTGVYHTEGQPESVSAMMGCFAERIVQRAHRLTSVAEGWAKESATRPLRAATRATKTAVAPLIKVKWNQSGSYKKYCPKDGNGQAIVGCVAVGMAQAMSVAQWPKRPSGEFGYDSKTYGYQYINYDKEPAYNWDAILSGANGNDDVARLLWHCGVAVMMDYGVDASGTIDSYIATALPRNFGYSASTVKYVQRRSCTDTEWENLVYGELAAGRAVCLSGQDLKNGYGHCFNLDGYDNGAYHVNWGWGGANNGYFELTALKDPTMNMDYSAPAYQSLIIGIQKPTSTVVAQGPQDITLSETSVASDAAVGTVVGDVSVVFDTGLAPEYGLKVTGTKYNAITHRYNKVPFGITDGQLVTTDAIPTDKTSIDIKITATDEYGYKLDKTFTITITAPTAISTIGNDNDAIVSTTYYNIEGQRVDKAQHGTYIVVYTLKSGKKRTAKIVKQ